MKKIAVSVTNDLVTDQRVYKVCKTLQKLNFDILLIGRELPYSADIKRSYSVHRFKLWFNKGFLFYAEYNIRLFLFLLKSKPDVLLANDLDTLPANFLASKWRKIPLVYDSHEYFTEVPEIQNKPFVKKFWLGIEGWIFPRLKHVYTVNGSLANIFRSKYGVEVRVVRNFPENITLSGKPNRTHLGLPLDKNLIILQGAGINLDRGAEELLLAMKYIKNSLLLIIGSGDSFPALKEMAKDNLLQDRVMFFNKMPWERMMEYTRCGDLGVSIDKDTNLNYHFSLPNKIFDYFKAGIPVLVSQLPEVEKIVTKWNAGIFINSHDPVHIAETVNSFFNDREKMLEFSKNAKFAAANLHWEKEEEELALVFSSLVG